MALLYGEDELTRWRRHENKRKAQREADEHSAVRSDDPRLTFEVGDYKRARIACPDDAVEFVFGTVRPWALGCPIHTG